MPALAAVPSSKYHLLPGRLRIKVDGLKHNSCFAKYLVERLQQTEGISAVSANPLTSRALIYFAPDKTGLYAIQTAIEQSRQDFFSLYIPAIQGAKAAAAAAADTAQVAEDLQNVPTTSVLATVLTGGVLGVLLVKRLVAGRPQAVPSAGVINIAALVTLVSGYPILKDGVEHWARKKQINFDLLIFMTTLILLTMRQSLTGLSILWLVHLSHLYRYLMQARTYASIKKMLVNPNYERSDEQGRIDKVPSRLIKQGDILFLRSGETLPVAATVLNGHAQVSQAYISGDCMTTEAAEGDQIPSGAYLVSGSLRVEAIEAGRTSRTANIERAIERERRTKPLHSVSDYQANKIIPWTVGIAFLFFFLTKDLTRSVAILLAGCPVAIALSRHAALGAAIASAASKGIYVKDTRYLEIAGQTDTVLFDKTGTLTTNMPEVMEVMPLTRMCSQDKVIELAASAVFSTLHPVAFMLREEALKRNLNLQEATIEPVVGLGVLADIDGRQVVIGNEQMMNRQDISLTRTKTRVARMHYLGMSVLYVAASGKVVGLIGYRDKLKPESLSAVLELRAAGIEQIGLLSGDHPCSASHVADRLCFNHQWMELSPYDKVEIIKRLRKENRKMLVVGDGINDAPALAAADVGVAISCSGQDIPLRSADVVIQGNDLTKVPQLVQLGKYTGLVIRQNLLLSTAFGLVGVMLAASRLISPVSAMTLLNFSTLAVLLNSGKIRRYDPGAHASSMDLQRFSDREETQVSAATMVWPSTTIQPLPKDVPVEKDSYVPQSGFHVLPKDTIYDRLKTGAAGLTQSDVLWRRGKYGMNVLEEKRRPSFWELLFNQFKDFMVQVLLGAAGLSFFLGRGKDALLTLAIVAANAVLGVAQERKAETSLEALQKMAAPQAKVIREGQLTKVQAEDLVPGDIIELEAGDRVPADARLLTCWQFEVEEASLTGETFPVKKDHNFLAQESTSLGDQCNMVFMGTAVTRGRARAVVVATGMQTEMGKVAKLIQNHEESVTPLQRRLEELGKYLVYGCLAVSVAVFLLGMLRGISPLYMLQTAAGLAVAAIPEGLSAIVIIALAMGVQRMSKRNIIIRKLSSIETLGCATVICSDKTGTLTKNEMTVRSVYTVGNLWRVTGEGYAPQGEVLCDRSEKALSDEALSKTLLTGALCNNSSLVHETLKSDGKVVSFEEEHKATGWRIEGDPTEGAMLVAAAKNGLRKQDLDKSYLRLAELPFEAERQMMSVICANQGVKAIYAKGSPDKVLSVCTHYLKNGLVLPLADNVIQDIQENSEKMASQALRVLACAYRPIAIDESASDEAVEQNLIFCGLVGMIDPPRPEVPAAVAKCRKAGVKVVMITGDHPGTAKAIAREIKLQSATDGILTGAEIDSMTDEQLSEIVTDVSVFARTSPHHKLRIVKALKSRGYVVAMTGDGVNDAPAVKAADIGIAMGLTGTDVTKEAASMTLADDNFATIVRAMEEGRSIYSNIRKAIRYLVATNIGEVILMLLAVLVGLPLPLIPIQLLWINLVGDGLPAIALVNDPPASDIMHEPPKSAGDSVFANGLGRKILSRGLVIGLVSLALFAWKLRTGGSLVAARTLVLAQLAVSQFIHIFDCRLERQSGKQSIYSNKWLVGAVALSMLMVLGIIHIPALQAIFGTMSLGFFDWVIAFIVAGFTALLDGGIDAVAKKVWPENNKYSGGIANKCLATCNCQPT